MRKQDDKGEVKIADYFVVALKILELEEGGEQIWFFKIVESLSGIFSRSREEIAKSLNITEDWFIVRQKYGKTSPRHGAGILYHLVKDGGTIIEIKKIL